MKIMLPFCGFSPSTPDYFTESFLQQCKLFQGTGFAVLLDIYKTHPADSHGSRYFFLCDSVFPAQSIFNPHNLHLIPYLETIQNGPPALAERLASRMISDKSHLRWLKL